MSKQQDEEKRQTDKGQTSESSQRNSARKRTVKGMRSVGASALAQEAERLQAAVQTKHGPTGKLDTDELDKLPEASRLAFGTQPDRVKWYRKLPINMATAELPNDVPRWRIEVEGLGPAVEPIGLDIIGDSVLGRGRVGTQPADLDLDQYGALEQGVSRRHALMRPTANHLYIIDLGSTNGTLHNGLPLGPGIARSLKHNDTVTLGRLTFTVKIIDGPGLHRAPQPAAQEEDEGESTRPLTSDTGGVAQPYMAETKTNQPKVTPDMIEERKRKMGQHGKKPAGDEA